ncbi:unnamed protein product [Rangifer tarandus platyrhynchus]|uniref:Uncharacterized protein n=1 Tax=Rangifer tarandus platyrhynchus TaxID=3082113 RepID=A0AC59Y3D8_RANTA
MWALSRKSGDLESSAGTVVREVFLEDEGQYLTGDLKDEGVGSSHVQRGRSSREKERNPQEALRILHKAEGCRQKPAGGGRVRNRCDRLSPAREAESLPRSAVARGRHSGAPRMSRVEKPST